MLQSKTMGQSDDEWITQREMADMVGVSDRTIRRWLDKGDLPSVNRCGTRRIHLSVVRAALPVTFECMRDDEDNEGRNDGQKRTS